MQQEDKKKSCGIFWHHATSSFLQISCPWSLFMIHFALKFEKILERKWIDFFTKSFSSLCCWALSFGKKIQKIFYLKISLFSYFRTTLRWSMTWRNSRNEMITALVVIQVTHTHSLNNWKNWKKYIYFFPQDHFAGDRKLTLQISK